MQLIVVGMDGSPEAASALAWAQRLATPFGATVVAVNGYESPYLEPTEEELEHPLADREDELASWLERASIMSTTPPLGIVRAGDPREILFVEAAELGADLLVLGRTSGGRGPGFLHLGSIVEHAAHHTTIPLAVIPAGWGHPGTTALVGVDGSDGSLEAVRWLAELAPAIGLSTIAVAVEEPFLEWTPANSPQNWRRHVEHQIEGWTAGLTSAGVKVTPRPRRDLKPADGILDTARAEHADLIVVGMRGLGGISGLRAGGVAVKVLHHAARPLVLVPRP